MSAHARQTIDHVLARRLAFQVRRDAAVPMPNGRVRYDALFSRIGIQHYGSSVEYRPPEEVFAPESLASGSNCPGVLLHGEENFGTEFGDGAHRVRGVTGDQIVQHTDGVHTRGTLIVWCREWNDLIESAEVAELSVGYSIFADDTPGVAPDGTRYNTVHRDIVWDHVAGVPAGNAGTARVMLDASKPPTIPLATRQALAEIAASRLDAKPIYHDLSSWTARRKTQGTPMTTPKNKQARDIYDAMVKLWGDTTDPKMKAAIAAMAAESGESAGPVESVEDEDPDVEDEEHESAEGEKPDPVEGEEHEPDPAAQGGAQSQPPSPDPDDVEDEDEDMPPAPAKMDAAARRHDSAHRRALILVAGMDADPKFLDRVDSTDSDATLMAEVIRTVEPKRLDSVKRMDAAKRPAALEIHYEQVRDSLASRRDYGQKVIDLIRIMRLDGSRVDGDEIRGPLALMSEQAKAGK